MNAPSREGIRSDLEKRRQDHRERARRHGEAVDAFAVEAVRSLGVGLRAVPEDADSGLLQPAGPTPGEPNPGTGADARRAIEARRRRPASASPVPERGEPPLRAALRGIVADYAAPVTPSERIVTELEQSSGIALSVADTDGLWAEIDLGEVLGFRAAMESVVEIVTNRAESVIIAELVAAQERLALEYPDVPRPDPDANDDES